ncbi:MAG TPA: orotidine 5'-phosphate decarboxylase [Candidatus Nitrosopolaris sp.]|nr:orotidine 5'-phosphate decarboxylase [Candidatus Nitrosopolaris sp.]
MDDSAAFSLRIAEAATIKRSRIILALDLTDRSGLNEFALRTISKLESYICAIKLNFHLLLPLSSSELSEVNRLAHSYGLESIADIKLNDIPSTNKVAITHLSSMGFDATTVNPFIGIAGLRAAVVQAHELKSGILALVYMSHIGAQGGFGINFIGSSSQLTSLYQKFFQDAIACRVDGVIVGANRLEILREISCNKDRIPIYSPGVGVQGGKIKQAAQRGTDYFIIGRSIIRSRDPLKTARTLRNHLARVKTAQFML